MVVLHDDIICDVLEYMTPIELLTLTTCNHNINTLISHRDKMLFGRFYQSLHTGLCWQFNIPQGSLLERVKNLSTSALRKCLKDVDTTTCLEKDDYHCKLIEKILFSHRKRRVPSPKWVHSISEWKATYFHALRDSHRTHIMKSELVSIIWTFNFKYYAEEDSWNLLFNEDMTMSSPLHAHPVSWVEIAEGIIQVGQYPCLHSSRRLDGSWMLENEHVIIIQADLVDINKPLPLVNAFI
jgi:hypothetical protein